MNHHHGTQLKQILTSTIFLIGILYSFQTCTTPGLLDNNGCVLPEDPIIPDDEKCLDYCKNNGINLLRIRYDDNIEEKLINIFIK